MLRKRAQKAIKNNVEDEDTQQNWKKTMLRKWTQKSIKKKVEDGDPKS